VPCLIHPNEPGGTSPVSITPDLDEQRKIIKEYMLEYIDGVECWRSRNFTPIFIPPNFAAGLMIQC